MKQKRMMTWSLRIQANDYRHDYEQYGNKIKSLGLHEWNVDADGKIAIYGLGTSKGADGRFTSWTDATTYDRYATGRKLWPEYIEPDVKRWPHIEYYLQMVIFGPETVSRLLDSVTAQDTFIQNLKSVTDLNVIDQNGDPINYTGLEIDCEGSFSDSKWDSRVGDDEKLVALLERIKNEIIIDHYPNMKLRANAHAMWGKGVPSYYRFHNYERWAESTDKNGNSTMDEVQIMTYDHSWGGSAPGPSTPLWWMREVAEWVRECFDPGYNPQAVCTIDNVYLGGAGYGRRWPIYSESNFGSSVTYRDLVDWQNAYLKHNQGDGQIADQDFIPQNGYNDPNSDNQIMYNHAYDYFRAKDMDRLRSMGRSTTTLSTYNEIQYATAYSKRQHMEAIGLVGVTGILGLTEPLVISDTHGTAKRNQTTTLELDGLQYSFQAYQTVRPPYEAVTDSEGNQFCQIVREETVLEYKMNIETPGTYRVGAIVSFPFYRQSQLGGTLNGARFDIGNQIPDYYPYMFDSVHVWDMGVHDLIQGENTIIIDGQYGQHGTVIFGFFASDELNLELVGGYMKSSPNVKKYKKRDGTDARLPDSLVMTSEVLRQSPRPAIIWEDVFGHYISSGQENVRLDQMSYYRQESTVKDQGGGTQETRDTSGNITECYTMIDRGFTTGIWHVLRDPNDSACAHFDPTENIINSGQLMMNNTFTTENISVEIQFRVMSGNTAGVRFASTGIGDGYLFIADFKNNVAKLVHESGGIMTTIATESMGDFTLEYDSRTRMRVMVNGGNVRCYIGNIQFFWDMTLNYMKPGSMGFYTDDCFAYVYMLQIATTERWETLERFSLIVDGSEYKMGEISRPGITRDEFGYLVYSGFNEINIRETDIDGHYETISQDYIFSPSYFNSWEGKKDVKVKLIDAGLWYKMLFIGDPEGMSIMYVGDEESLNKAMNIAVYDYNCKGIGLWTLGQADPRIYETIPDVVPWHE